MSVQKPKITVITPTYNRVKFIKETIQSVLAQNYQDFEYLILDDGSTDNTKDIVKPFLKDSRVKYLYHSNQGEAETVNWGWQLAKGDYFTQVNSDDPILPGLFTEMTKVLDKHKQFVVAYPDFYFIDNEGEIISRPKNTEWNLIDALSQFSCYAASAGTFIRRNSFKNWKKIKDKRFKHISDIQMYWEMALVGDFCYVPKYLATWRDHLGGISAERHQSIPEIKIWFEEYFSQTNLPKNILAIKQKTRISMYSYFLYLIGKNSSNIPYKNAMIREYNAKRILFSLIYGFNRLAKKITGNNREKIQVEQNNYPLVSIIIPVYNGSNYLNDAIESALTQTYSNIEIIVINDGSTDNTETLLKSYGKRITYYNKKNGGVAAALNLGITKAKGEYISWLSHDDSYVVDKVEKQIKFLKNTCKIEESIVFSDYLVDDRISNSFYSINLPKIEYSSDDKKTEILKLLFSSGIHGCTLLIPKKLFLNVGFFDEKLKTTQNYDLWFKFINADCVFYHLAEPLIITRLHTMQDSRKKINIHKKEVEQLFINTVKTLHNYFNTITDLEYSSFVQIMNNNHLYKVADFMKKRRNKKYEFRNLQVGDNDLIGNKFNGHDLHLYLREKNINSSHLVWNKESDDIYTYEIASEKNDRVKIREFTEDIQRRYHLNAILNPLAYDILYSRLFLESDVIHLHLIQNGIVDIQILPLMTRLKPIVWTIHDPWVLSGHCIEYFNCNRWKDHCGDCPYLDVPFEMNNDNTAMNLAIKRQAIQNSQATFIVASKFIEETIKQSPTFKNKKIYRIPFGINLSIFKPKSKKKSREKLGVPEDALVISFRGDNPLKKGIDIIEYSLDKLESGKKIYLLIVGGNALTKKNSKYHYKEYGWLKDDYLMSDIYNASDIFLMPSMVETFGMMAIEAMSCGVMPLVLDGTALPEVVNAPTCGVSVKRDKNEYAKTLQYFLDNERELVRHGKMCYKFAKKNYDKDIYIEKIIQVYRKAIDSHKMDDEAKYILNQTKKYISIIPGKTSSYKIYPTRTQKEIAQLSRWRKTLILTFYKVDKIAPKSIRKKFKPIILRNDALRNLLKY